MRKRTAAVLTLIFALWAPGQAACFEFDDLKASLFVDALWLKINLPKVVVVDARAERAFKRGHIPGAVSAPWQKFARMYGKPGDIGWGVLLPKAALSEKIGALGIDGGKPVVVYAKCPGWGEDGRFAWMMRMAEFENIKILDGGYAAWRKAGGEVTRKTLPVKAQVFAIRTLNEALTATTDWILAHMGKIKIVDTRNRSEFNGARRYGEARGGHLPGAIHIPFDSMFQKNNTLKNSRELSRLFQAAGLGPEDDIVACCTGGIRSAHMILVLHMLGFDKARNYDASLYEWAAMRQLPLER